MIVISAPDKLSSGILSPAEKKATVQNASMASGGANVTGTRSTRSLAHRFSLCRRHARTFPAKKKKMMFTTRGDLRARSAQEGDKVSRSIQTRLVHMTDKLDDPFDSVAPPIYQTATFNQPGATDFGPYDYSRSGNPTRTLLENQMADIENADGAFAFASGMAAIATVMRLVKPGESVLAGNDIYGGTQRFLGKIAPNKQGLHVRHVDMTKVDEVRAALEEGAAEGNAPVKLVLIESPTNPRLEVCDIAAISAVAKEHGAVVCVDNSIMAPIFQRPIDLGADISMTSATKVRRPRSSAHSNYPSRLTVRLPILPAQVHRGPL